MMRGTTPTPDSHRMRQLDPVQLAAWRVHLQVTGHPPTTVRTYLSALTCAARELPYGLQATSDELLAWLATRRSAQTRATYTRALRAFYGWCVDSGRIRAQDDPSVRLPRVRIPRRLPRPIAGDDLDVILGVAREPYRTWMVILLYCGLRCIELAHLHREDVDPQYTVIRESKAGTSRTIPTHPAVWQAVRDLPAGLVVDHTAIRHGSHPPSASPRSAERISGRLNKEIDRVAVALGRPELARITAHQLRHTAATWVLRVSGDLRATQEFLGHASVSNTQVYAAVADDRLRAAVLAMPTVAASGDAAATATAPARALPPPARYAG